jgi:hypothetical protein
MSTKQHIKERQIAAQHRMIIGTIFLEADEMAQLVVAAFDVQGTTAEQNLLKSKENHFQSLVDDLEALYPDNEIIRSSYMEVLDRQILARQNHYFEVKNAKSIF